MVVERRISSSELMYHHDSTSAETSLQQAFYQLKEIKFEQSFDLETEDSEMTSPFALPAPINFAQPIISTEVDNEPNLDTNHNQDVSTGMLLTHPKTTYHTPPCLSRR